MTKYRREFIFPYGEVLVPIREEVFVKTNNIKQEEVGWLSKALIGKLTRRNEQKKQKEIELLKLDIEIAELNKKLKSAKK